MSAKNTSLLDVYGEGEKIPDNRIRDVFRAPPNVPLEFHRSALIIGSRGAGKTTLFRYLKLTHEGRGGIALHIPLVAVYQSLTKQTVAGPWATNIDPAIAPLLAGKAATLLALSLIERLLRKGFQPNRSATIPCLPPHITVPNGDVSIEWTIDANRRIAIAPPENFAGIWQTRPLPTLIESYAERLLADGRPLLLLFDRADLVAGPLLFPVLEILDQSTQFIALVATRPGHAGPSIASQVHSPVPGDHYELHYLGAEPRSSQWVAFMQEAIEAQLGECFAGVPDAIRIGVTLLARDSCKVGLELFARYCGSIETDPASELYRAIEDARTNMLASATVLRPYLSDFRALVNESRQQALKRQTPLSGPVVLNAQSNPEDTLFSQHSQWDHLVSAGLRAGILCVPEGTRWVPGGRLDEAEIFPILTWHQSDGLWRRDTAQPIRLSGSSKEILRESGGPPTPPAIFIAYRMQFEESKRFRSRLASSLEQDPTLSRCRVIDGKVPGGVSWATEIRDRIKRSRVVIGDVTGLRSEVIFELGFAFGLGKILIPCVASRATEPSRPEWLGEMQLEEFGSEEGLNRIISSVAARLADSEFARPDRPPKANTRQATWVRSLSWHATALAQFESSAANWALTTEVLVESDISEPALLKRAARASLLFISLDGTSADALMHFICGAVVARPTAGTGRSLKRQICIIRAPDLDADDIAAEGLTRCGDAVRLINLSQVRGEVERFGKRYRDWYDRAKRATEQGRTDDAQQDA